MKKLNEELKSGNQQTTFEALRNAVKLVDVDNSVVLFQSYADRYYKGLIKEKKEGLPSNVLVRGHHKHIHLLDGPNGLFL